MVADVNRGFTLPFFGAPSRAIYEIAFSFRALLFFERTLRWSPSLICMHALIERWSALDMLAFGGPFMAGLFRQTT